MVESISNKGTNRRRISDDINVAGLCRPIHCSLKQTSASNYRHEPLKPHRWMLVSDSGSGATMNMNVTRAGSAEKP